MSALDVYLGEVRVGLLEQLGDEIDSHRFTPDASWLAMRGRPILGQIFEDWLPASKTCDGGMIPWFDHLLPLEHRPQRRAIARDANIDPSDTFAMLAWLGDDLIGAVRLRAAAGQRLRHRRAMRQVVTAPDTATYRASLPGAQWKLSLAEGDGGLVLPVSGMLGAWIGKFHAESNPSAVRHEYATMNWARAAGVTIPEIRRVRVEDIHGLPEDVPRGNGEVYLIRRFDRVDATRRVHAEDFAQILDLPQGVGQFSGDYEAIAAVLAELCPRDDLRAFVRQLVFVVLSGNDDAHAKNWSLIYPDGRHARLSPAYDLCPTVLINPGSPTLALRLNGDESRSFAAVTSSSFERMASLIGVSARDMTRWVHEDAERVRAAWASSEVRGLFLDGEQRALEGHMGRVLRR